MSAPFEASPPASDDGIPAADPGRGGPEPAPGFGVLSGEPDVSSELDGDPSAEASLPEETPFRTPDPREVTRDR